MVISRLPVSRQLAIKSESGQLDLDAICSRFFFFLSSLIFVSAVFLFFSPHRPTARMFKEKPDFKYRTESAREKSQCETLRKTLVKRSSSIGRGTKGHLHTVVFQLKDPELHKT